MKKTIILILAALAASGAYAAPIVKFVTDNFNIAYTAEPDIESIRVTIEGPGGVVVLRNDVISPPLPVVSGSHLFEPPRTGSYRVTVFATNAGGSAAEEGYYSVPNRPPAIPTVSASGAAIMGEVLTLHLAGSDPDHNLVDVYLEARQVGGTWSRWGEGASSPEASIAKSVPYTFAYSSPASFGVYEFRAMAEDSEGVTVAGDVIRFSPSNPTKVVQIKARNIPDTDLAIWFNESAVTTENITVHKYEE
jgi:hypothetical protein